MSNRPSTLPNANRPSSVAVRIRASEYPRSRRRATTRALPTAAGVQLPSYSGTTPARTQRRSVSLETPAAAAASLIFIAGRESKSPEPRALSSLRVRNLVHIHQTAELAERVLLPGDPGRALRLAQELLIEPKMLNHNRGLWGYTGTAADGRPCSVQSTGMGGPSAAIVTSELIELGAMRLLRIGTCGSLTRELDLGRLLVGSEAIADDGTSTALGGHQHLARVPAPGAVTEALVAAGEEHEAAVGAVVSSDLFYDAEDRVAGWVAAGALAVEMEAAAVFTVASARGVEAGCALLVSNRVAAQPEYLSAEALHAGELRLGALAITALS